MLNFHIFLIFLSFFFVMSDVAIERMFLIVFLKCAKTKEQAIHKYMRMEKATYLCMYTYVHIMYLCDSNKITVEIIVAEQQHTI